MSGARGDTVQRRVASAAKRAIRRSGLLPSGMPDRLGDEAALEGRRLEQTVMVYFADTRMNLYQLRLWYGPLRELDRTHPVVVVTTDSRAAKVVRAELGLPVITISHYRTLDALLARSGVKLALYVNQNPDNFSALRFTSLVHVFLSHGDSDKGVAVSNQCKAYDYWFVPGQAGIDRAQRYMMLFDAEAHCVKIGRPQADLEPERTARPRPRPAVLYAPTWEGAQDSLAYGSIESHGEQVVGALLASGRYDVIYRPHPLSGSQRPTYGDADARIRERLAATVRADPSARHRVLTSGTFDACLDEADLLVCDVSAVAVEWLPSGKPMIITVPTGAAVVTASTRMLDVLPRLSVADLPRVVDLVDEQVQQDPQRAARADLVEYYVGDPTRGASLRRFVDACTEAIAVRDREWARVGADGSA